MSVAGTKDAITMVEAWSKEVSEKEMLDAIIFGHNAIKDICEKQQVIIDENKRKMEFEPLSFDSEVVEFLDNYTGELKDAILVKGKLEKYEAIENLSEKLGNIF